ncbi:MAG: hypothetical protein A2W90_08860 [Bacteroidetes bacterium GWF2_42_66]|nr:MAG: hypothetical protein A2W92_17600 [Bacteroidetes bacterium GWA2_42_15]OFX96776.1 MAG: hypothetical protein A2W89_21445 [Bacteroidetes bacterium GWE2_42_39]OFY45468.1 MAG: hypothetical protein A2W90_08860 [Bacteroidetes bacterium GWF2_42_66]HBL76145.1 hypothetical protein [Prolixibacteraceae bacterium]HCR91555.1 hypothetical protein [Prolixibacteraceae bacterium]
MRIEEKFDQKLLVEGNDDQRVIWALCDRFKIHESFDVIDCEGISELLKEIPVRLKQSGIRTIGIIVDADSDISARWDKFKSIFDTLNYIIPEELPVDGLVVRIIDQISIGIWIMPNNDINGMLEDFISFLIPNDDRLLPIVKDHVSDIERKALNKYIPQHRSKAIIHSWLSLQEDPGIPMGQGITKRYLSIDEQICVSFICWLNRLFNEK